LVQISPKEQKEQASIGENWFLLPPCREGKILERARPSRQWTSQQIGDRDLAEKEESREVKSYRKRIKVYTRCPSGHYTMGMVSKWSPFACNGTINQKQNPLNRLKDVRPLWLWRNQP
jgi:hypothetical protein